MSKWKPISKAPKDRPLLLMHPDDGVWKGYWSEEKCAWLPYHSGEIELNEPRFYTEIKQINTDKLTKEQVYELISKIRFAAMEKEIDVAHVMQDSLAWRFIAYIASNNWDSSEKDEISDLAQLVLMAQSIPRLLGQMK